MAPKAKKKLPYRTGDIVLWISTEGGGGGSARVANQRRARWAEVLYCTDHRVCLALPDRDEAHTFVRPENLCRPPKNVSPWEVP